VAVLAGVLLAASAATAQEPRRTFRAAHYEVHATLKPATQVLEARVKADFLAVEVSHIVEVELHPNLKVTSVLGSDGKPVSFDRDPERPLVVRATLAAPATAGQKVSLTFEYAGPLANEENSPVKDVRLAEIGSERSYLLLPARWFPLTGFPGNRYTAEFHLAVPEGMEVVGTGKALPPVARPGTPGRPPARPGGAATPAVLPTTVYTFRSEREEAAGTFVIGTLQRVPVDAAGMSTAVYAPASAAGTAVAYGESLGRIVDFFSDEFGALPRPSLSLAQLPEGTVPGYAAPGLVLVGARQWDPKVNYRLLAQLAAQEWWGLGVMPATSSDAWLSDGLSRYAEALYVHYLAGQEGFIRAIEEMTIAAMAYEDAAPVGQAARLVPYSPEYRSVVVNKGAAVFHMLRAQVGDDHFRELLRDFYAKFSGKAARIEDFQKLAEEKAQAWAAAKEEAPPNLRSFFAQWLNSTGVPEFRIEYIVKRIPKGFRIEGKVSHDLETFRMPVEVKVDTDGNPEFKRIEIVGPTSDFTIETFGRPRANGVLLDPNNNLLKSSPRLRVRAAIARGEGQAADGRFYDAIQEYQRALDIQRNNSLALFRMGEAFFYQKNWQAAANAFREAQSGDLDLAYKWVEVWSHIYLGKIFDLTGQRERAINEYSKARELADDTGGAQAEVERWLSEPYKEDSPRRGS
jgi:tetratricopeptide (TPR) repeat protein